MTLESTVEHVALKLFGLALTASGGFFLYRVTQVHNPDIHLVRVFGIQMAVGTLLVAPDLLLSIGQRLMALFLEYKNGKAQ
jgi:hypothetical protein